MKDLNLEDLHGKLIHYEQNIQKIFSVQYLSEELVSSATLAEFVRKASEIIVKITDIDAVSFFLKENNVLKKVHSVCSSPETDEFEKDSIQNGLFDWAFENRKTVCLPYKDDMFNALLPLITIDEKLGIVSVFLKEAPDNLTSSLIDFFRLQLSFALDNLIKRIEINRNSEMLDSIVSNISTAVLSILEDGSVTFYNAKFLKIFGLKDAQNKNIKDLLSAENSEALFALINKLGDESQTEAEIKLQMGSEKKTAFAAVTKIVGALSKKSEYLFSISPARAECPVVPDSSKTPSPSFKLKETGAGGILKEALKLSDKLLKTKKIDVAVKQEEDLTVNADENACVKILGELINYIISFQCENAKLTVKLRRNQNDAEFEITDSSGGLPPSRLEDELYKLKNKEVEVSGDGLFKTDISAVLKAHNGCVTGATRSGAGVILKMKIPLSCV